MPDVLRIDQRPRGLVIERKPEQSIEFIASSGERIVVKSIGSTRAKLHIVAPLGVDILRGELTTPRPAA